ncbi:conjugal transfer protein TraI [Chitinophaga sp. NPDC101104]|uniref:conjugal transfer protein TraI n=1 Tax=Chitinophaga sp. NPDC101104 TaxID=3390561 RepID=UPI003D00B64C
MRKAFLILFFSLTASLLSPTPTQANPIVIIIKTAVKKILRAMDLAVQRLQNQTIRLQNAQKALENLLSKLKLEEISAWGEKQRKLFAGYYDELHKVRTAITYYKRIRSIIEAQAQLIKEYKHAVNLVSNTSLFKPTEVMHMLDVYTGILNKSVENIDQITGVITSFTLQMSDAQRLDLIHKADKEVQVTLTDLRSFTNQNIMLAAQRLKDKTELQTIKGLYDIEP